MIGPHSLRGTDMYARPFDPWASERIPGTIPVVPPVTIRADARDITMPPDGHRETCGEIIARMERNASDDGRAQFYAAVRANDRAEYIRRFEALSQMGDR